MVERAPCGHCGVDGPVVDWDDSEDGGGPIVRCAPCAQFADARELLEMARAELRHSHHLGRDQLRVALARVVDALEMVAAAHRALLAVDQADVMHGAEARRKAVGL